MHSHFHESLVPSDGLVTTSSVVQLFLKSDIRDLVTEDLFCENFRHKKDQYVLRVTLVFTSFRGKMQESIMPFRYLDPSNNLETLEIEAVPRFPFSEADIDKLCSR